MTYFFSLFFQYCFYNSAVQLFNIRCTSRGPRQMAILSVYWYVCRHRDKTLNYLHLCLATTKTPESSSGPPRRGPGGDVKMPPPHWYTVNRPTHRWDQAVLLLSSFCSSPDLLGLFNKVTLRCIVDFIREIGFYRRIWSSFYIYRFYVCTIFIYCAYSFFQSVAFYLQRSKCFYISHFITMVSFSTDDILTDSWN